MAVATPYQEKTDEQRAITEMVRQFADERDWHQFHTPKNLAIALSVEAAELLEQKGLFPRDAFLAACRDRGLLERLGIGRPSTYAATIGTIERRGYIFRQGKALVPSYTAFAVTREEEGLGVLSGAWMAGTRGILLMQTSGTTSRAKVVPKTHRALLFAAARADHLERRILPGHRPAVQHHPAAEILAENGAAPEHRARVVAAGGPTLDLRGAVDRGADAEVGGAAADVPVHRVVDVGVGRVRVTLDERDRRHDLAGLAVPALRDVELLPRLLHGVRAVGAEPLDRRDAHAFERARAALAGADGRAVHVHRTRAALAHAAAELGALVVQRVPQDPEQRGVGRDIDGHALTVELETDGHGRSWRGTTTASGRVTVYGRRATVFGLRGL